MVEWLIVMGLLLVLLNAWASYVLFRSPRYESQQKIAQTFLIWVLPCVGALLVVSLAKDKNQSRLTTDLTDRSGNDDGWIRTDSSTFEGAGDASGD